MIRLKRGMWQGIRALVMCAVIGSLETVVSAASDRETIDLSGSGWTLWQDVQASWTNDELFLPPVDITRLPVNPPSGGWSTLDTATNKLAVSVPGTVEGYLGNGKGAGSDIKGVSWWYRTMQIPKATGPRRILLRFESARLRTEVFVDQKLVGYDLIGNTPFEVDITDHVKPGQQVRLALRITDPDGNFSWVDCDAICHWGKYNIPLSHGFGGVTGRVRLLSVAPVYVDDVYMQNTPAMRDVNAILTIRNTTAAEFKGDVSVSVRGKKFLAREVFARTLKDVILKPGENTVTLKVSAPAAELWSPETPVLYTCNTRVSNGKGLRDNTETTFGFRWFGPDGIGTNAVCRLNGKRVFFFTAISWGFWPVTGMVPSPEHIDRQILLAKELGMNMLNFHRCIGDPRIMERANELGLMYFEEPGGYISAYKDPFAMAMSREKLLRMVKRDRSQPCLVIYNMINEQWDNPGTSSNPQLFAAHKKDLKDAHDIDPSRLITYTSAWSWRPGAEEITKLHMRPFDNTQYLTGWFDHHRAMGPMTWDESMYVNPRQHVCHIDNKGEVWFWGEEAAISAPPRIARIKDEILKNGNKGWDSAVYLDWAAKFEDYFKRKNLSRSFKTIDDLCLAMSAVSLEHQGRRVETAHICELNDGYAINGWEGDIKENHSGIVDCYRNPKGDPQLVARYARPVYVAIKPRKQILEVPGKMLVDVIVVNKGVLTGPHSVKWTVKDPAGKQVFENVATVNLKGGDLFSQVAAEAVEVPVAADGYPGSDCMFKLDATLLDSKGRKCGDGQDDFLAINWRSAKLQGQGAVYEYGSLVRDFLKNDKGIDVPAFDNTQGKLDWLVIAKPAGDDPLPIEADCFVDGSGKKSTGVKVTFFKGNNFTEKLHERTDKTVDFDVSQGAPPDPSVSMIDGYCVRWEGLLSAPVNGSYVLACQSHNGIKVWIGDKKVIDHGNAGKNRYEKTRIDLKAGTPVQVKVEYVKGEGDARAKLSWVIPGRSGVDPETVIDRAAKDGTTIIVLANGGEWMPAIQKKTNVKYKGAFGVGRDWVGGQYFVMKHPLFKDLPVDCGLSWPYYSVIRWGGSRYGLFLDGEELVAGAYHCNDAMLGTAVGVVPCGKGRIVVSTLDIASNLGEKYNGAHVARKLLCNYIEYAGH